MASAGRGMKDGHAPPRVDPEYACKIGTITKRISPPRPALRQCKEGRDMKISSGARNRRMKSFKPWIIFSTVLMIGIFLLLPVDTAHAQESLQTDMTIESTTIIP